MERGKERERGVEMQQKSGGGERGQAASAPGQNASSVRKAASHDKSGGDAA